MTSEVVDVDLEGAVDETQKKVEEDVIHLDDDEPKIVEIPDRPADPVTEPVTATIGDDEPMQVDKEEPVKPDDAVSPAVKPDEPEGKAGDEVTAETTTPVAPASSSDEQASKEAEVIDIVDGDTDKASSDADPKPAVEGSQAVVPEKRPKSAGNGEEAKTNGRHEDEGPPAKLSRTDLQSVPTRQYLDQTVVPILLTGMAALSKDRPAEPIEYLADYLLKHKSKYDC